MQAARILGAVLLVMMGGSVLALPPAWGQSDPFLSVRPARPKPPPPPRPAPRPPTPAAPTSGYPAPIGGTFRDCPDCPELVVIPAGRFQMGSSDTESDRSVDEGPQHEVVLRSPLAVGKYAVTFAEWDACSAAGGCTRRPSDLGWGRDRRPVINVSWDDAHEYARWLSGKTGHSYRLLTEAEWEYAARGGTTTAYWWGPSIGVSNANCDGCGSSWDDKQSASVGSFRPNPFGLYDMLGNVWQWVEDCYAYKYQMATAEASIAMSDGRCFTGHIVRGGAWTVSPKNLRVAFRNYYGAPGVRQDALGFRLARTAGG